ncbi:MAG: TolC family protein [Spartobacteria bacterium]|nr:TolC family protein [Spartobacteria bacterium]
MMTEPVSMTSHARQTRRQKALLVWGAVCLGCFSAGCRSTPRGYETPPMIDARWESAVTEPAPVESVAMLMQAALDNSRAVRARQRRVALARADTRTLATFRDPELRLGYHWANGDGHGVSQQTATSQESGRETGSSTSWNENYPRSLRSTQTEEGSSRSSQQSQRTRNAWEDLDEYAWGVGVRLYPPNPWEYAATVSRVEAELRLEEAALREEQLDVMREVIMAVCALDYEQKRLRLYKQLEAVIEKETRRAEQLSLDEQTDLLRRALNARTRILRLERSVNGQRRALELLCGQPLHPDALDTAWDGLPSTDDTEALEFMVGQADTLRPDVAAAYWQACEVQSRARQAAAEAIPWFRHLEVSYRYAERDQSDGYTGQTDSSTYSESTRSRWTENVSGNLNSEITTRSGRDWSAEQETGSASSTRTEDEWRVETAVNIPVFDWLSGHGRALRRAAKMAWRHVDETVTDAERELHARIQSLKAALREARLFDEQILPEAQKLREQHDALYRSGQLSPADSVRLAEEISDTAVEGLAARESVRNALAALWIACGAPVDVERTSNGL